MIDPLPQAKSWSLYMIRCGDRSLYTGISNHVASRFAVHESGQPQSAKYLRGRHPLTLVYSIVLGSKSAASQAEYWVKKLPKHKKEQLISGEVNLADLGIFPESKSR